MNVVAIISQDEKRGYAVIVTMFILVLDLKTYSTFSQTRQNKVGEFWYVFCHIKLAKIYKTWLLGIYDGIDGVSKLCLMFVVVDRLG